MEISNSSFLKVLANHSSTFQPEAGLGNLTIVIPTCDRPLYLLRQIAYLSKWQVAVEIVDGSLQPLAEWAVQLIEKIHHINYRHMGGVSYTDRISRACEGVKTTYVMCLADDDFYLQSGVVAAIKALESDHDAVACMGQSLGFDAYRKKHYFFNYGSTLRNYSVKGPTAAARIHKGVNNYRSAAFYAVFRSDAFLRVWRARDRMSCLEAAEYEHAIRTYLCGGLITTPNIYWLRSFELQPVSSAIDGSRTNDFASWYNDADYRWELACYKDRLVDLFCKQGELSMSEAVSLFDLIIKLILEKSHVGLMEQSTAKSLIDTLLNLMNHILPGALKSLKETRFWHAAKNIVLYATRSEINKDGIGDPAIWSELQQVLEFTNSFSTATKM